MYDLPVPSSASIVSPSWVYTLLSDTKYPPPIPP